MTEFKIIEGLPEHVELDVNRYLSDGWKLNGNMFHRNVDGNNVAVQSICRETPTVDGSAIHVFRLTTTSAFDPQAMIHVMYHKPIPVIDGYRHTFQYIVKILSTSVSKAEANIEREFKLQFEASGFSGHAEYIHSEEYNV